MKKKSLKPRSLLFALCLLGCMQIMAVPEKRTTSFQFFSTFAKKFLPAHYQSPLGKHDGNAKTLRKSGFKFLAPPLRTEEETPDYTVLVMPPPGLVTEKYTLISFILTSDDEMGSGVDMLRRDDHRQELLIGFERDYPGITIEANVNEIAENLQKKTSRASVLAQLRERRPEPKQQEPAKKPKTRNDPER